MKQKDKKIERHRNAVLTKNNSMFFNTKSIIGTVFVDVNQKSITKTPLFNRKRKLPLHICSDNNPLAVGCF